MKQRSGQSASDYMSAVELEASRAGIEGDQLRCVIVQALLSNIRQFVVTREDNDVNSLRRWLTVADGSDDTGSQGRDLSSSKGHPQTSGRNACPRSVSVKRPGKRITKEYDAFSDGTQGPVFGTRSITVAVT